MEYERFVDIVATHKKVGLFLSEEKNLPLWTYFFQSYIGPMGEHSVMKTSLGECLTRCELVDHGEASHVTIVSRFKEREESATVVLTNHAGFCRVSFRLFLPPSVGQPGREQMLKNLEKELVVLKNLLEGSSG